MYVEKKIGSLKASNLIKEALGANAVEMVIERHGSETEVRFKATIEAGQVCYSAYRESRGGKAHDGRLLPVDAHEEVRAAWSAFAEAILEGKGVDQAYGIYLSVRMGVSADGSAAPHWDHLREHKPELAQAWADAANALNGHTSLTGG